MSGADADPNHDGIADLIHSTTGTDPVSPDAPAILRLDASPTGHPLLRCRTRAGTRHALTAKFSDTPALGKWSAWRGPALRTTAGDFVDWEVDAFAGTTEIPPTAAFRPSVR